MEALDEVRRRAWNETRQRGRRGRPAKSESKRLKDSRWALWKNPDSLTGDEQARLAYITATHPRLHRAWALKEGLRTVFRLTGEPALAALTRWLRWAQRCRIPAFVRLDQRIRNYRGPIAATLQHGLRTPSSSRSTPRSSSSPAGPSASTPCTPSSASPDSASAGTAPNSPQPHERQESPILGARSPGRSRPRPA